MSPSPTTKPVPRPARLSSRPGVVTTTTDLRTLSASFSTRLSSLARMKRGKASRTRKAMRGMAGLQGRWAVEIVTPAWDLVSEQLFRIPLTLPARGVTARGMSRDKVTDALVDALKLALTGPPEQRLYRSGKLDGLFPGRAGTNAEAAALALRDGLLEVVRTETRGKSSFDWVRLTPRGVEFLHERESPVAALHDLR